MLRCWDADPAERPLFCELSSAVSIIIAKMTAAAAAAETDERRESETDSAAGLPPVGYVNAPPVTTDYLRPVADRRTAEPVTDRDRQSDSSDSAPAAPVHYVDDSVLQDSSCDINPPDNTDEFGTDT